MTQVSGDWLTDGKTQAVFDAFEAADRALFAVGGCVRNDLLGVPVSDVDMATNALPKDTMQIAEKAGLRAIPTGIDHGTITVVSHGTPYEITTFRDDVETDGRRAVVSFSKTAQEDAHRRDFTINALYADRHGHVHDFVGGLEDLKSRTIRFIDDPQTRIREDYLRILRFFRFHAWYADPDGGMDADALDAIARLSDGLGQLSKERVTQELLKLLSAPDPTPSVAAMAQTGALIALLPGADMRSLGPLVHLEAEAGLESDPLLRLASVCREAGEHLRLSNKQSAFLETILAAGQSAAAASELGYRIGEPAAHQTLVLRAAWFEQLVSPEDIKAARIGSEAKFPVSAADLMPAFEGRALGERLKALEARWIASGFSLSREALLNE